MEHLVRNGDPLLKWLHSSADAVVACACLAIIASLFYLARKYRVKRLSTVFYVYGTVFLCGGITQGLEAVALWRPSYGIALASGLLKSVTALACCGAAFITVRCAKDALVGFSRLAVYERQMGARLKVLERKGEEDREWVRTLREMRGAVNRMAAYAEVGEEGKGG